MRCNRFISSSYKFHLNLLKLKTSYLTNHHGLERSSYVFTFGMSCVHGDCLLYCFTFSRQFKEEQRQTTDKHV